MENKNKMRTFVYIGTPQHFDKTYLVPGQKVQEDFTWGSKTATVGEIYDNQTPGCEEWALEEDAPRFNKEDKEFIKTCAVEAMKTTIPFLIEKYKIEDISQVVELSFHAATLMNEKRKELNA